MWDAENRVYRRPNNPPSNEEAGFGYSSVHSGRADGSPRLIFYLGFSIPDIKVPPRATHPRTTAASSAVMMIATEIHFTSLASPSRLHSLSRIAITVKHRLVWRKTTSLAHPVPSVSHRAPSFGVGGKMRR